MAVVVFCAWLWLIAGAFAVLGSSYARHQGNELTLDRAVFTTVNAATLTGFSTSMPLRDFKPLGQAAVFALIGGGALMSLIVGGIAVERITGPRNAPSRIVQTALWICALAGVAGGAAMMEAARPLREAVFTAVSALANAGQVLGLLPDVMSWRTHAVLLPLAVIGGLGVPVMLDLIDRVIYRRPLRAHTTTALAATAAVYLIGTASLAAIQAGGPQITRFDVITASTAAMDARTLGFGFIRLSLWSAAAMWLLMLLMLIGGSSGGTAGGMKVTTLVELSRGIVRLTRGQMPSRVFGIACAWLLALLGLVAAGALLLLFTNPSLTLEAALLLAISAACNVGWSSEPVGIVGPGLYTLSALMLLGRILPLAVLWWTATSVEQHDLAVG